MPSGRLCSVTARTSISDFPREDFRPSGSLVLTCRCGTTQSSKSRNAMPTRKPTAAGTNAKRPSDISIAGIRSDQIDAAIITPDAKPSRNFCTAGRIPLFAKKTQPAPSVVPARGSEIPNNTHARLLKLFLLSFGANRRRSCP